MWRSEISADSPDRAGRCCRNTANFLIPSDSHCSPAPQRSESETRREKREGQQSLTSPSFKCPFEVTPAHPSCLFCGMRMKTALPGTGLSRCWNQALLCHPQQGDSPGGQQGREAFGGPFWGVYVDIPKHSTPGHVPSASPQPSPSSQSYSADEAPTAPECWGGVGNKWVKQTKPREKCVQPGLCCPGVSAGQIPRAHSVFSLTAKRRSRAAPININTSLNKHPCEPNTLASPSVAGRCLQILLFWLPGTELVWLETRVKWYIKHWQWPSSGSTRALPAACAGLGHSTREKGHLPCGNHPLNTPNVGSGQRGNADLMPAVPW